MNQVDDKPGGKDVVGEAARRVQNALTQLGLCYKTKDGHTVQIGFRSLELVRDSDSDEPVYGLLEVDTTRLPPKVGINRLTHDNTLHHLTAVVGKPVKRLNTTGLTYCVLFSPKAAAAGQLPGRVLLDVNDCPPELRGKYPVPIGVGLRGPVWKSIYELGHCLVGGESGSGKSMWLNSAILSLLATHKSTGLRLALADPKSIEFTPYRGVPHLFGDVATTVGEAGALMEAVVEEMERRQEVFSSALVKSLDAYNRVTPEAASRLPLLLVVIDEVTDIALQAGVRSALYKNLIRTSSKGRALGVYLVLATQNPKAEVLNTLIRGNLSTRISFRVASSTHSRTILGVGGADASQLPGDVPGRFLARCGGGISRMQGYYVPDSWMRKFARAGGRR